MSPPPLEVSKAALPGVLLLIDRGLPLAPAPLSFGEDRALPLPRMALGLRGFGCCAGGGGSCAPLSGSCFFLASLRRRT